MFANEALIKQNDAEHSTYVTCHHSFFSSFGTNTDIALPRCAASTGVNVLRKEHPFAIGIFSVLLGRIPSF